MRAATAGDYVDTVMVAVGGGGLMSGVATALEGHARIVGVEPTTAPTLHAALAAGEPVDVAVSGIAADSLGARRIGAIAWEVANRMVTHLAPRTRENQIIPARTRLDAETLFADRRLHRDRRLSTASGP